MLSLRQVTLESARYRWYGARRWSPLLQNVSFDIAPGEMVALVGGSGEGKSLLLQCLLDLLPENLRFRGKLHLMAIGWTDIPSGSLGAIRLATCRRGYRRLIPC